jgi:uncharacterized membrane protein
MNEEKMLKPALIGAVALGILSSLPLVSCLCCFWAIAGGVLAAYLYVKDSSASVTLGRGVGLGLLTGILGTIVMALFSIPLHILVNPGAGMLDQVRQSMSQVPSMPPETRRMLEGLYEHAGILYAVGALFMLVFFGLFGMVGGAIGVAIFEKRKHGDSSPPPSYQPPADPILPPPPVE